MSSDTVDDWLMLPGTVLADWGLLIGSCIELVRLSVARLILRHDSVDLNAVNRFCENRLSESLSTLRSNQRLR